VSYSNCSKQVKFRSRYKTLERVKPLEPASPKDFLKKATPNLVSRKSNSVSANEEMKKIIEEVNRDHHQEKIKELVEDINKLHLGNAGKARLESESLHRKNLIKAHMKQFILPEKFDFTKSAYFPILDIASRTDQIWICASDNAVYKYDANSDLKMTITSNNNPNIDCTGIAVDNYALPWVITSQKTIAGLRRVYQDSYVWRFFAACAVDISCGFFGDCYFIGCGDDFKNSIYKIDPNNNVYQVTNSTSPDSKTEAIKIAIGVGIEGEAIYIINNKNEIWKFENHLWSIVDLPPASDIAVSDRNDLYLASEQGTFVLEKDQMDFRKVFNGSAKLVGAGLNLWVYTSKKLTYYSSNSIN